MAVMKQIDALYFNYANDEPTAAEKSLLKSIDILEKSSCFDNSEREGLICLEYSRLAVMAHKLGKKDEEEAYLLSAKYYQLKCLESANIALHEAIKVVNQMNVDHQTLLIEKMDKNLHNGKLATYNQSITHK